MDFCKVYFILSIGIDSQRVKYLDSSCKFDALSRTAGIYEFNKESSDSKNLANRGRVVGYGLFGF